MIEQTLRGLWNIHSSDNQYNLKTEIPGTLMYALEQEHYFGEEGIFWKCNNRKAREVADRDFTFSRNFKVDQKLLNEERIYLECDGLDTLAEISINGQFIGKTANMHRRFRFEINNLVEGDNEISILFANTIKYIEKKQQSRFMLQTYYGQPDIAQDGFNQIRKSHCSYGWDWGPIVPDLGIWRDIRLCAYSFGRLDHVQITQNHSGSGVLINMKPRLDEWSSSDLQWKVHLICPDGSLLTKEGAATENLKILVEEPELWWPNGLGEQPLYKLEFSLFKDNKVLQQLDKTIGLRVLDVDRTMDQWGQKFNFRCNGRDFFAMGADYIPEDLFLTRMTAEKTRWLMEEAVRANFNSIRVWGGGFYPDESFYRACDELGLVVWQDFMFACAVYDMKDQKFKENIRLEAIDVTERLHHHASLGLICGNNEMEMALIDWPDFVKEVEKDPGLKDEYLEQYEVLLKNISETHAPDTFYWPASPSSGGGFEDPNAPEKGDCHFWDVWHGYHPYEEYEQHYFRFMSEFGFESFPHWKTVESFSEPSDYDLTSEVMEDHQRGGEGSKKLKYYLDKYFREPRDFRSLVYLSQVSQAEAIRHGIEHWRRNRGRCMGAVYWQFNDNWPVNSWSSIDYYGRWKALHYQAKRDFEALLLTCRREDLCIELHLSNESWDSFSGEVEWQLLSLNGEILAHGGTPAVVSDFSSKLVSTVDLTGQIKEHPLEELALSFQLKKEGSLLRSQLDHFVDFKHLKLEDPQLDWSLQEDTKGLLLKLNTAKPAFFVEIDLGEGEARLSDNFFHLNGLEEKSIIISDCSLSLQDLKKQIKFISLFDSYHS